MCVRALPVPTQARSSRGHPKNLLLLFLFLRCVPLCVPLCAPLCAPSCVVTWSQTLYTSVFRCVPLCVPHCAVGCVPNRVVGRSAPAAAAAKNRRASRRVPRRRQAKTVGRAAGLLGGRQAAGTPKRRLAAAGSRPAASAGRWRAQAGDGWQLCPGSGAHWRARWGSFALGAAFRFRPAFRSVPGRLSASVGRSPRRLLACLRARRLRSVGRFSLPAARSSAVAPGSPGPRQRRRFPRPRRAWVLGLRVFASSCVGSHFLPPPCVLAPLALPSALPPFPSLRAAPPLRYAPAFRFKPPQSGRTPSAHCQRAPEPWEPPSHGNPPAVGTPQPSPAVA